jgi:molybdopterin-containing oxidoreductase family membrane subunit
MHYPSAIDLGVFIGTIGLFFVFFLLFARFFPVLALNEVKTILKSSGESYKNNDPRTIHPYMAANGNGHDAHSDINNH